MPHKVAAIIPAAGTGSRMSPSAGDAPKQFLGLAGEPVLIHALRAAVAAPEVGAAIVAAQPGREGEARGLIEGCGGFAKPVIVVAGGKTRQQSVALACGRAASEGAEYVLVHDAARPLVSAGLFSRVLEAAREAGAAVAALPSHDTVKLSDGRALVERTLDRSRVWLAQTPQGFRLEALMRAQKRALAEGWEVTDEAGLIERSGGRVALVMGSRENIKITTPGDLELAQRWMQGGEPPTRVGQGLDVHRLVPGRPLILGGVHIDYDKGLLGHSDADVLTHAVMDALLAAAGMGDIGAMFPDNDPAYEGANSLMLLGRVVARLAGAGWRPCQLSVTMAAQSPKLSPHWPEMRSNLARELAIGPGMINLAATTTEGLGFTGRGEGMAAMAVAVISRITRT